MSDLPDLPDLPDTTHTEESPMRPTRRIITLVAAAALLPLGALTAPASAAPAAPAAPAAATSPSGYTASGAVKIDVMGEWAHPDDDTSIIGPCGVWHARYGTRCGMIMVTRGEGGGNAVGDELGPALG